MSKRAHISAETKIASLLAEVQHLRGDPIPFAQLRMLTAAQICSLYEWDHATYHCWAGGDHFSNLTPRLIFDHREKTGRDRKVIAKVARIERKKAEARAPAKERRKALMACGRGSEWKRKLNGQTVRR